MRRSFKLVLALAACAGAAACAPNPIIARDPVPAPTGLERFRCDHIRGLVNDVYTECEPAPAPAQVVVRAKG